MKRVHGTVAKAGAAAAILAGALLPAASASAHHSNAMYDLAHLVTVEATVKSFEWLNPHSSIEVVVAAKGSEPARDLSIELTSPGVLTRAGWTKRSFAPGDRIQLTYGPLRSGGAAGLFQSAVTSAGKVMTWSFKPGEGAP